MKTKQKGNLHLGSNVVELLLPQRRPFLMVDFIESFTPGAQPELEAGRHISANEAIFGGHFPAMHIWPGTFTIEGLGQTSALLMAILILHRTADAAGDDPQAKLGELRNLHLGYRLHPGHRAEQSAAFLTYLRSGSASLAIGGSVDMKFLRPVFAGQRLDYRSRLIGELDNMMRFACEASVDGTLVASGMLSGALIDAMPVPAPRLP